MAQSPDVPHASIDSLFPVDDSQRAIDEITLGFEDVSLGGYATHLLREMDDRTRAAFHSAAFSGIFSPDFCIMHIMGLVNGLDKRDPRRTSTAAVELALAEIDSIRALMEAFAEQQYLPVIGLAAGGDSVVETIDAQRIVWEVAEIDAREQSSANLVLNLLDGAADHLRVAAPYQ